MFRSPKFLKQIAQPVAGPPQVIDTEFLNKEEIFDIKKKVLNLQSFWQYLRPHNHMQEEVPMRFVPCSMYSRDTKNYIQDVKSMRNLMKEHFFDYYQKIKDKLEKHFNLPVEYSAEVHYPGFHVFSLNNCQQGSYPYYYFHKDNFPHLEYFTDAADKIYSFIIPITLPESGGNLFYTFDKKFKNDILVDGIDYKKFQYQVGSLNVWEGNLAHSIEPFQLKDGQYRITMQFHAGANSEKLFLFW
jgi:hypothetical protein